MWPSKKLNVIIGLSRIWATKTLGISATKLGDLTNAGASCYKTVIQTSSWNVIPNVDSWTYYDPLLQPSGVKSEKWKPDFTPVPKNVNPRSSKILQNSKISLRSWYHPQDSPCSNPFWAVKAPVAPPLGPCLLFHGFQVLHGIGHELHHTGRLLSGALGSGWGKKPPEELNENHIFNEMVNEFHIFMVNSISESCLDLFISLMRCHNGQWWDNWGKPNKNHPPLGFIFRFLALAMGWCKVRLPDISWCIHPLTSINYSYEKSPYTQTLAKLCASTC